MEFVYVVPRRELFTDCYPQGFRSFDAAREEQLRTRVHDGGFFVEREVAERTPRWKQIIPYSIVLQGERVLLTRRLAAGGEKRLHNKLSIGVGGHINPEDLEASDRRRPIEAGTRRELEEELHIDGSWQVRALGTLNDDSNPVGAVHLGWVQIVRVEGDVRIRETDVLEGSLVAVEELSELLRAGENFESWSAMLIPHLGELLPTLEPVNT